MDWGRSYWKKKRPSSAFSTSGTGRNGASVSRTTIGPAPGPPPPCGVLNVLCVLKWTMSKPMSPGRLTPSTALALAPS